MTGPRTHDDETYFLLVHECPLRPIRSDEDLARAIEMIDRLSIRTDLNPAESDYLDVLDGLVSRYESERFKIHRLSDSDFLRELIEARQVTQREVAKATGIVYSTISAVLAGRRTLTRDQIVALARYFHVPAASFLAEAPD
jgi:HTH-type transcriptional regulator / antitoxin HigA